MAIDLSQLSRVVSHALRHEPWLYELEIGQGGWVPVDSLLDALRAMKPGWSSLRDTDLSEMVRLSQKQRHELRDGRIRALYGHSTPEKLIREPARPPSLLYHGTAPATADRIAREGLRPMKRQYVHLSVDAATAEQVGRRKAEKPFILKVRAEAAHDAGVRFYRGNEYVWLADLVPPTFIDL